MNTKRILGIIMIIGGVVLLAISSYINTQVGEGKTKVASAQKKIEKGQSLFSLHPVTEELSKGTISGAKKKIASAEQTIAYYQNLADQLQMGGIALIIIGGLVLVLVRGNKKKK